MVVGRKFATPALPEPGDIVDVLFGFDRLRGKVVESYFSGSQSHVLVALERSASGEGPATVTVPANAVEPVEPISSPWAQHQRYEHDCARQIRHLVSDAQVVWEPVVRDIGADFVVVSGQKRVFVEVKYAMRPLSRTSLRSALKQLSQVASKQGDRALLITNVDISHLSASSPKVGAVRWRDQKDDRELKMALAKALE